MDLLGSTVRCVLLTKINATPLIGVEVELVRTDTMAMVEVVATDKAGQASFSSMPPAPFFFRPRIIGQNWIIQTTGLGFGTATYDRVVHKGGLGTDLTITAAIAALVAVSTGGTIGVCSGTYTEYFTIPYGTGEGFVIEGIGATPVDFANDDKAEPKISNTSANPIITIANSAKLTVRGIYIHNTGAGMAGIKGGSGCTITLDRARVEANGFAVDALNGFLATDSYLKSTGSNTLDCQTTVTCINTTLVALATFYVHNGYFTNFIFDHCTMSTRFRVSSFVRSLHLRIEHCTTSSISIVGPAALSEDLMISSNEITAPDDITSPLELGNLDRVLVTDNILHTGGGGELVSGINISDSVNALVVDDNVYDGVGYLIETTGGTITNSVIGTNTNSLGGTVYGPSIIASDGVSFGDHGFLDGLADDDHTQYVKLAGRALLQEVSGGATTGGTLRLYASGHHSDEGYIEISDGSVFLYGDEGIVTVDAVSVLPGPVWNGTFLRWDSQPVLLTTATVARVSGYAVTENLYEAAVEQWGSAVALWRLNEKPSLIEGVWYNAMYLSDATGNGYTGTLSLQSNNTLVLQDQPGAIINDRDTATLLPGNSLYYWEIPIGLVGNSVVAWVKKAADGVRECIVSQGNKKWSVDIYADNLFGLNKNCTYLDYVVGIDSIGGVHYRCDEASGNLTDSSAYHYTAVAHGTPTYSVAGAIYADTNTAISLNGNAANYFEIARAPGITTADTFTLIAWIKKAADGVNMMILSRSEATGYQLRILVDNTLSLEKDNDCICHSAGTITGTDWHMVVVTKNGSTRHMYIDGVEDIVLHGNHAMIDVGGVLIGKDVAGACPWNGSLDEIGISSHVITATEVAELYEIGRTAALQIIKSTATITGTDWHQIFVTSTQCFLDGVDVSGVPVTYSLWNSITDGHTEASPGTVTQIGRNAMTGLYPFNGTLDEIMVCFDYVTVPAVEVVALYNTGSIGGGTVTYGFLTEAVLYPNTPAGGTAYLNYLAGGLATLAAEVVDSVSVLHIGKASNIAGAYRDGPGDITTLYGIYVEAQTPGIATNIYGAWINGLVVLANGLHVATIDEFVTDAGVTIETVLIKDGLVDGVDVSAIGHAAVTLSVAAEVLLSLSTQEIGLDTQAANLVFAGPTTGAVAAPTFRSLVLADIPAEVATWEGVIDMIGAVTSFYFTPVVSDLGGSYYNMTVAPSPAVSTDFDTGDIDSHTNTLIYTSVSSVADMPAKIAAGLLDSHVHALRVSGGRSLRVYATFHVRSAGGVDGAAFATTELSNLLTAASAELDIHAVLAADQTFAANERLVIKTYINSNGGTPNTTVGRITIAGTTASHISVGIDAAAFDHVYLTPAAHTAIGDSAPHHASVTLAASAAVLMDLTEQAISLDTQAANTVLAGRADVGAALAPTFRALVALDIPDLSGTYSILAHTHADYLNKNGTVALTGQWNPGAFIIGNYDFTAKPASLYVGDANVSLTLEAGGPILTVDTGMDFFGYVRASNYFTFVVGGVECLRSGATGILVDHILELTADHGVEIDGVPIKDGLVDGVDVSALTATAILSERATQAVAAATTISVTDGSPLTPYTTTGNITSTAVPFIAAGREGQLVILRNDNGSGTLTLSDTNIGAGGSLLRLSANTVTMAAGSSLCLVYSTIQAAWVQQWYLALVAVTPAILTHTINIGAGASNAQYAEVANAGTHTPTFAWTFTGVPSSGTVDVSAGGDVGTDYPHAIAAPYTSLTSDAFNKGTAVAEVRTFTPSIVVNGVTKTTPTATITYVNRRYIGPSAQTAALTTDQVRALDDAASGKSSLSTIRTGSFSDIDTAAGEYIWYAYRAALGAAIYFAIEGEIAGFTEKQTALAHTNDSGFVEDFRTWRSDLANFGNDKDVDVVTSAGNNRFYMGPSTDTDPISNANILALDDTADGKSGLYSSQARTWTAIKIEAGEYLWYCHPDRIADLATIKDGTTGFAIAGSYRTNVSHTNQYGYVEDYRCWRSDNTGIYPSGESIVIT